MKDGFELWGAVAVDDSAAVGCDVHAAEPIRIAGDHVSRVVPVVVAIVDLRPVVATGGRTVVPTHSTDLAGEIDGRVGFAGGGHPEADAVGKHYVRQLGEAAGATGCVPDATCPGFGAAQ